MVPTPPAKGHKLKGPSTSADPVSSKRKPRPTPKKSPKLTPKPKAKSSTTKAKPTEPKWKKKANKPKRPTSFAKAASASSSEDEEEAWARGDVLLSSSSSYPEQYLDEGELSFFGGEDLASPQAGPSRLPMSPVASGAPSSFTPLRSILSGMTSQANRPSSTPTTFGKNITVDPTPNNSRPNPAPPPIAEHFQPPGLFSTTLDTALQSSTIAPTPQSTSTSEPSSSRGLLLPDNITLDGAKVVQEGQESYVPMEGVHFLDDNIQKGTTRYFVPEQKAGDAFLANADQSKICQNCKKPGHRQRECPHVICTVCGAMDQHERRDCPHGLVCFGCGQRGHRQTDCPDPKSRHSRKRGCDRCGSREHPETACPSIWRVYCYRSMEDREAVRAKKRVAEGWAKEATAMSDDEEWCYNCAGHGHLGDDCPRPRASFAKLFNPTAFSYAMASRGPFFHDVRPKASTSTSISTHARWDEDDQKLPFAAPEFQGGNAGKKTREKARKAMIDKEHAGDVSEEEEDWFNRHRSTSTPTAIPTGPRAMSIRGRGGKAKITPQRRPWDSDSRPTQGRNDPPREMPFGHSHLMASAPASARGRSLVLDKLDSPDQRTDSPSAGRSTRRAKRGGGGEPANQLLTRALQGARQANSPAQSSDSPMPSTGTPTTRRKKRKADKEDGDEDAESKWWSSGKAGGNVAGWGKDMPSSPKGEGKAGKNAGPKVKGQQYTGGY